ncbi:3-deoxy-D-manno-octulosonate 8-phosphate phosphatase [Thiosulfatimonas sediminis]|uniref:3-deoxy-D-manno-octulosonate 8-phosphate phosphatase KdsC n=1 Tax=Thiosulfatimonas sediminis TaxID=2675054 RepID=A0A6F8PTD9_9GAMM|nr:3-deoxy-manno-octulosonate-8-phosphatase KdsC [Thiosulfatimonas sediminis]BBP45297.1 3-deoxy-D-manno-octulosonate 8-phosphate phosphatase [Thiosulfatimonas sediminis]
MHIAPNIAAKAQKIKFLILDVDGVLTDNRLYYSDSGEELKAFYTRDGHGMVMLKKSGVDIGIITGRTSKLVAKRCQDLKINHLYMGVPDKLPSFLELLATLKLAPEQIAYIGDDILDLPILKRIGFSITPADGEAEVKSRVDYVSNYIGGQGVVREVCEIIMRSQGTFQQHMDFYLRDLAE